MSKPSGDKMMTHYINIENGVLKLMRTMPNEDDHKYWSEDHWKDIFHKDLFDQALTQAKADSVEIAPEHKKVIANFINFQRWGEVAGHNIPDGIYEITTNGVFEVRHKGFFNGGKVEWVRGHAPTNDYEELAYYSEEPKEDGERQPEIFDEFLREVYRGVREKRNHIDVALKLRDKFTIQRKPQ